MPHMRSFSGKRGDKGVRGSYRSPARPFHQNRRAEQGNRAKEESRGFAPDPTRRRRLLDLRQGRRPLEPIPWSAFKHRGMGSGDPVPSWSKAAGRGAEPRLFSPKAMTPEHRGPPLAIRAPRPNLGAMTKIAAQPERAVLAVTGEDRVAFLQGLVSNDVAGAAPGRAVWAALLTPQGKWLADFFILSDGTRLLLDCERAQAPMIKQRLTRYRLRSRVALAETDLSVHAAWDGPWPDDATPDAGSRDADATIAAPDPRLPEAGWRVLSAISLAANASAEAWDRHRLALGLPDGSRDLEAEKSILLEAGFDELNGVSWTKGCYMGQELTARTKYRGLVKRRLVPVRIEGAAPVPGTPVLRDGREVGTMRSARPGGGEGRDGSGIGMAVLRLEAMEGALTSGAAVLTPLVPAWMRPPSG